VPLRKDRAVVKNVPFIVPRIPGTVAFNDLLERITDRGMEIDGQSKLTAMERRDETHFQARAKILKLPTAIDGVSQRRRGAPLPRRGR
jgi:hypothetical protein